MAHGHRRLHLQGRGRSSCQQLRGRSVFAATVGYVAAGVPRPTLVVMGQEAAHDDSTVAWLLAHSLTERQREEEAREAEEVRQSEEKVAEAESHLLEELEKFHGDASRPKKPQAWAALSSLEQAAVQWHTALLKVRRMKEKRKRRKKQKGTSRSTCSCRRSLRGRFGATGSGADC